MDVEIRRISPGEIEPTAALFQRVLTALPYYNDRAKSAEAAKYTAPKLLEKIVDEPDSVLVASRGSEIVGFCFSRNDDGLVWLDWFGVDAAARQSGIGAQLLTALGATAAHRNAHKIWCDTRTENVKSQRLLQKIGFQKIADVSNHWHGQDFILWEWYPRLINASARTSDS